MSRMSDEQLKIEQDRAEERGKKYRAIYDQDIDVGGKPHGWIQWKGTNVCMDLHCACGEHAHIDADFFYYYRCSTCGASYAVGQNILLIPLTEEQVKEAEQDHMVFQSGE